MSPYLRTARVPALRAARPAESGWVLAATLVLTTMASAVTITYARHALLAKQSLQFGKGASEVDEASRSELERVRELMRIGDKPGTLADGEHDEAVTPTGEIVRGERECIDQKRRELRVHAQCGGDDDDDGNQNEEARLRARSRVIPGSRSGGDRTTLECDTGSLMMAGNLTIISGSQTFQDTQLAGLFLLEEGAELTLEDCVLRGTIITRHGVCRDNPPATGANRPTVRVYGGLRLLAGTELPDVAMCGPDARFETDDSSRVEVRGFVSAEEVRVKGRGSVRGMVVNHSLEEFGSKTRRPGHGRGHQDWPGTISCGAEEVSSLSFPTASVAWSTLNTMSNCDVD
jgi:hypothetical protein